MGKVMYMRKGETHTKPGLPTKGTALNNCTWEQIRAVSDEGLASEYFSIGDTKAITIDGSVGLTTFSNLSVDVFIIGIDHNAELEGGNRIHFQIGKIDGVDVCLCDSKCGSTCTEAGYFTMNASITSVGGWASCPMRSDILGSNSDPTNPTAGTLLAALPSDLRAVMKDATKYTDNTGGGSGSVDSHITATTDYLWLLTEWEVVGARYVANTYEQNYQKQYAYYSAGNSQLKYKHGDTGTPTFWWLRSPSAAGTAAFGRIQSSSGAGNISSEYSYGIAPAFCV